MYHQGTGETAVKKTGQSPHHHGAYIQGVTDNEKITGKIYSLPGSDKGSL